MQEQQEDSDDSHISSMLKKGKNIKPIGGGTLHGRSSSMPNVMMLGEESPRVKVGDLKGLVTSK